MFKRFGIFPILQSNYKSILLVVLVFLFLMQRCGLLFFGYSHIAHPGFDETASGVLTCDLIDGEIRAPLFVYQYEPRSGDALIEGLLLVPFFKLFGRSLFPLKILALSSAFLCMICWLFLIKRYHGKWAAIIFTALFAFPPPMFARLNLLGTIGSHHMINPLIAVQLLFLFSIIEGGKNKGVPWLWLGFGFLSGLGAYTFYNYIIFNSFCLLFLLLFKSGTITLRRILFFSGGFFIGFSPWFFKLRLSSTGGTDLVTILKSIRIDLWSFIQDFGFNLPHSFGYNYPSHGIGLISLLFFLFILFFMGVLLTSAASNWVSLGGSSLKWKPEKLTPSVLQGLFFVVFPLCFLICLSLSYMKIGPFGYWPTIGFFGSFSCTDVYRYRWLHLLFPFYFGIVAVGMINFFKIQRERNSCKVAITLFFSFFLLCSVVKSVKLYSMDDFNKLFYYKGYSYDQIAKHFILSDYSSYDLEKAREIILDYPEENLGKAYRWLGEEVTFNLVKDSAREKRLEQSLKEVPPPYVKDFTYGIARAAYNISEKEFQPFEKILARKLPTIFYESWGFRYLGYKYYGLLLNWEKVLKSISPLEKWFFRNFLEKFEQIVQIHNREIAEKNFLDEISKIPIQHQPDVVRGLGMLVGAEMLFDPMFSVDYPLDSRFAEKFNDSLKEAFYEGVGGGFAETLCRFWRTLLLQQDPALPFYEKGLDLEWGRCHALMSKISPSHAPLIKKGFWKELEKRHLNDGIRKYLQNKYVTTDSPL